MKKIVLLLNYFMILLFIIAGVFQYNDIDGALWMGIYGAAALACILWRWSTISQWWYRLLIGICVLWGIYLLYHNGDQLSWNGMFDSVQMKNNSIEIIREVGGLFIIAFWMTVLSCTPQTANLDLP